MNLTYGNIEQVIHNEEAMIEMSMNKPSKAEEAAFIKICELISEMSLGMHATKETVIFNEIDKVLRKNHKYKPYPSVVKQLSKLRITLSWYQQMLQDIDADKDDLVLYANGLNKLLEDKGSRATEALTPEKPRV